MAMEKCQTAHRRRDVLRADGEDHLHAIAGQARAAGLPVQVIRDAGRTQVAEGTATCCAIGK